MWVADTSGPWLLVMASLTSTAAWNSPFPSRQKALLLYLLLSRVWALVMAGIRDDRLCSPSIACMDWTAAWKVAFLSNSAATMVEGLSGWWVLRDCLMSVCWWEGCGNVMKSQWLLVKPLQSGPDH